MEVKPIGSGDERYVLTYICVYTRYVFLRAYTAREAPDLATILQTSS